MRIVELPHGKQALCKLLVRKNTDSVLPKLIRQVIESHPPVRSARMFSGLPDREICGIYCCYRNRNRRSVCFARSNRIQNKIHVAGSFGDHRNRELIFSVRDAVLKLRTDSLKVPDRAGEDQFFLCSCHRDIKHTELLAERIAGDFVGNKLPAQGGAPAAEFRIGILKADTQIVVDKQLRILVTPVEAA